MLAIKLARYWLLSHTKRRRVGRLYLPTWYIDMVGRYSLPTLRLLAVACTVCTLPLRCTLKIVRTAHATSGFCHEYGALSQFTAWADKTCPP